MNEADLDISSGSATPYQISLLRLSSDSTHSAVKYVLALACLPAQKTQIQTYIHRKTDRQRDKQTDRQTCVPYASVRTTDRQVYT